MNMKLKAAAVAVTILLTGCATNPFTGEQKVSNAGWGAGAGALVGSGVGALVGKGTGAAIGAGVGLALGGGIGHYLDIQEAELRQKLVGTGVQIERNEKGINLVMPSNITFAVNSFQINRGFEPVLESVAIVLNEFDDTFITVTGFTDSSGSFQTNQILSENRAKSVASYLVKSKIDYNRINATGLGERFPIDSNKTPNGRAKNRRVVITIGRA